MEIKKRHEVENKALYSKISNIIRDNINELEKRVKELQIDLWVPIKQVAYRFNLDNDEIYVEYPSSDTIDEQNEALRTSGDSLEGVDERIFKYLMESYSTDIKYIIYQYFVDEDGKNIITSFDTTIDVTNKERLDDILKSFSIIRYGAYEDGSFRDECIFDPKLKSLSDKKLIFIVERFKVICALSYQEKESFLTSTFELDEVEFNSEILKKIKHLVYALTVQGKAILNEPLSQEVVKQKAHERFNEKVKSHRHSIFNLRTGYNNAMGNLESVIRSCIKSNCVKQEDIYSKLSDLKTVYEIYNLAVVFGISEESEIQKIKETLPQTISGLIDKICTYCSIVYGKYEQQYINNVNITIESSIEAFTILFNLLINAAETNAYESKSDKYNYYKIETATDEEFYYISIMNPAIINDRCLHFMNDEKIDLVKYPYDEIIKKWGGLVIVKKLNKKLGWYITFSVEEDWTKVLIKIKH